MIWPRGRFKLSHVKVVKPVKMLVSFAGETKETSSDGLNGFQVGAIVGHAAITGALPGALIAFHCHQDRI